MLLVALGLLAILHAAWSTIQYREELKLRQMEFTSSPPEVYLECFVGLALCIIGVTRISGDFQTIRPTELLAKMRFDTVNSRPDFAIFHHRGRVFNGGGLGQ